MNGLPVTLHIIQESDISAAVDQAIRGLLCACFPADREAFERQRAWHDSAPEYTILARSGEQLVGHVAMVDREVLVGANRVRVAGVQNFCLDRAHRRTGLSQSIMGEALAQAAARQIPFGLLFCLPSLENLYHGMGWRTIAAEVTMQLVRGERSAIDAKNIAMVIELRELRFPMGPIDLQGPDW